jgi:CelD/BcsL family acetyltransferase involved in cellulose biosynthesis
MIHERQESVELCERAKDFEGRRGRGSSASTLEVIALDSLFNSKWDSIAVSHAGSSLFHRTAWGKVVCTTYGHRPFYLDFRRNGESVALVPMIEVVSSITGKRGVSIPFSDFCAPLVFDALNQELIVEELLKVARQRKWRSIELRGGRTIMPEVVPAAEKFYSHKLNLAIGVERLFGGFSSAARRAVRKAEKSKVTSEVSWSWEAMREFYRLHARTRRRHGLPPQPLSFFRNIHREIVHQGLGFVVLAKLDAQPIAGGVFFHSGRAGLYKFGASDERESNLRGNNFVIWQGIKELVKRGVTTLDFGRTELSNEGLRHFKLSWGCAEQITEYFKFSARLNQWLAGTDQTSKLHQGIFRRLPLLINRMAGRLIYPHLD